MSAPSNSDLAARIERLEHIEAIRRLKHRYCTLCDRGYDPDGLSALFLDDAVWDAGPFGTYTGRAAIRDFFQQISAAIPFAEHLVMNETIDVANTGTEATGHWWILMPHRLSDGQAAWLLAEYDEEYRRRDGAWYFQRLRATIHFQVPHRVGWGSTTQ
ncbi:MAG: nuclear transport factor 2 family protein [Nitrospirota bacterium]